MGAASSSCFAGAFESLGDVDVATVKTWLDTYKERSMDFGIRAEDLQALLRSTPEKIAPLAQVFDNGNGTINALDFITGAAVCAKGSIGETIDFVFDAYDFDLPNGQLTQDEVVILLISVLTGVTKMTGKGACPDNAYLEDAAAKAFAQADKDGSASITKAEFHHFVTSRLDTNADGEVSVDEFLTKFNCLTDPAAAADAAPGDLWARVAAIKASHPDNLCVKNLSEDFYNSLAPEDQHRFWRCVRTGVENADSGVGCYAMSTGDYDGFKSFFDPVIRQYHKAADDAVHETDWDISAIGDGGVVDLAKLGLSDVSMRVRVGRNLASFNLPGLMDRAERIKFELAMLPAFEALIANPEYGGKVYSLSPDHGDGVANPNLITSEQYDDLVAQHVMFKNMDADPYLKSAGIASDWPYGRGCWQSEDKQCIIWFGEEDQLRIMCMKKGTRLDEVFTRLKTMLDTVEAIDGIAFAKSDTYGYVTSCPSNLGTGMRASVHIKVPNLTSDGTDARAKAVCRPLGLSVRGTGGEHTPIGADGTVDISPSARLFIKERDIVAKLYQGIQDLMEEEAKAAGGDAAGAAAGGSTDPDPYFDLILDEDLAKNQWPAKLDGHQAAEGHKSLMAQVMTREIFEEFKDKRSASGWSISRAINTGTMYPTSFVGCHAGDLESWDLFAPLFHPVVEKYHKGFSMASDKHVTDMDPEKITTDLTDVAKSMIVSTRIRVARNLGKFPLNPGNSRETREEIAALMEKVFEGLEGDLAGDFYRHTTMTDEERQGFVDAHFLFRGKDKMQAASGYHEFWPHGRGLFINKAKTFLLWINEGDHIRIISMENSGDVKGVFTRLARGAAAIEEGIRRVTGEDGEAFMKHPILGCVTCCPSNLGTGMRGGVHILVPKLIAKIGFDEIDKICREMNCQARGSSGEHSEVVDRIDISNWRRLGFAENVLIQDFINCVNKIAAMEKELMDADGE